MGSGLSATPLGNQMKKVIIILLLSLNVVYSQSEELKEALKYYPLHIGDYWQFTLSKDHIAGSSYEQIGISSIEIVGDTVLDNGIRYFKREVENMGNYILSQLVVEFIRIDSTSGLVYGNHGIDDEFIIDSLLSVENDTVDYFIINDVESKIVLGVETETKFYSKSWMSSYDFDNWEISKGFGLTLSYYGDATQLYKYQRELVYARINGNEYGELVNVNNKSELPKEYKLFQNYPNPFNPKTIILFKIPMKQYIKLKIYDSLGKELATIVEGVKNYGLHTIEFDGTKLSSGVYHYELDYGNSKIVKKMLLLK